MSARARGEKKRTRYAPPNWDEWESRRTGKLYQAIALACDIDPNLIRPENPGASASFRYQIALEAAVIALTEGQIAGWDKPDFDVPPEHAVGPFSDFARWQMAPPREWKLPKRFPGAATREAEAVANDDPPQTGSTRLQDDGLLPRSLGLTGPKMKHWLAKGRVRLWQATVLSFGVDPDLVGFRGGEVHRIAFVSVSSHDIEIYRRRLDQAESHVGESLVVAEEITAEVSGEPGHKCMSMVRLRDFGAWMSGAGMKPPDWFPSPLAPKKDPDSFDPRERTTLLVMVAALAKKLKIDIDHPTPAGKQIVDLAETQLGVSIGQRTVENSLKKVPSALDKKAR